MKYFVVVWFALGWISSGFAAEITPTPAASDPTYHQYSTLSTAPEAEPTPTPATPTGLNGSYGGILFGFGGSSFYGANASNATLAFSHSFGAFYLFSIDPAIKIQSELTLHGIGAGNKTDSSQDSLNYVELPLSLLVHVFGENYLYAGLAPAFSINSSRNFHDGTHTDLTGINAFECSGFLGGEVMVGKAFGKDSFVGARGHLGLMNLSSDASMELKNLGFLVYFKSCFD